MQRHSNCFRLSVTGWRK